MTGTKEGLGDKISRLGDKISCRRLRCSSSLSGAGSILSAGASSSTEEDDSGLIGATFLSCVENEALLALSFLMECTLVASYQSVMLEVDEDMLVDNYRRGYGHLWEIEPGTKPLPPHTEDSKEKKLVAKRDLDGWPLLPVSSALYMEDLRERLSLGLLFPYGGDIEQALHVKKERDRCFSMSIPDVDDLEQLDGASLVWNGRAHRTGRKVPYTAPLSFFFGDVMSGKQSRSSTIATIEGSNACANKSKADNAVSGKDRTVKERVGTRRENTVLGDVAQACLWFPAVSVNHGTNDISAPDWVHRANCVRVWVPNYLFMPDELADSLLANYCCVITPVVPITKGEQLRWSYCPEADKWFYGKKENGTWPDEAVGNVKMKKSCDDYLHSNQMSEHEEAEPNSEESEWRTMEPHLLSRIAKKMVGQAKTEMKSRRDILPLLNRHLLHYNDEDNAQLLKISWEEELLQFQLTTRAIVIAADESSNDQSTPDKQQQPVVVLARSKPRADTIGSLRVSLYSLWKVWERFVTILNLHQIKHIEKQPCTIRVAEYLPLKQEVIPSKFAPLDSASVYLEAQTLLEDLRFSTQIDISLYSGLGIYFGKQKESSDELRFHVVLLDRSGLAHSSKKRFALLQPTISCLKNILREAIVERNAMAARIERMTDEENNKFSSPKGNPPPNRRRRVVVKTEECKGKDHQPHNETKEDIQTEKLLVKEHLESFSIKVEDLVDIDKRQARLLQVDACHKPFVLQEGLRTRQQLRKSVIDATSAPEKT